MSGVSRGLKERDLPAFQGGDSKRSGRRREEQIASQKALAVVACTDVARSVRRRRVAGRRRGSGARPCAGLDSVTWHAGPRVKRTTRNSRKTAPWPARASGGRGTERRGRLRGMNPGTSGVPNAGPSRRIARRFRVTARRPRVTVRRRRAETDSRGRATGQPGSPDRRPAPRGERRRIRA